MRSIGNSSETTIQSNNNNETNDLTFTNESNSPAFIATPLLSNTLLKTDAQNKIISLTPSSTNLGATDSRFLSGYFNTLNSTALNVNDLLEVTSSEVKINSNLTVDNTLTAAAATISGTLNVNDLLEVTASEVEINSDLTVNNTLTANTLNSTTLNVNDKLEVTANAVDVKTALTVGTGHTLTAPTANITTLTANSLNSTTLNVNDKLEVTANAVDVKTALTLSAGNTLTAPIANISLLDSYSINAVSFKVTNKLDIISNSVDVYTDLNVTTGNTLTAPIAVFGTLTTDSFTTQQLTAANLTATTASLSGYLSTPNLTATALTATTLNSTLSPKVNTVVNLGLTTNRFANGYFTNVDSTSITASTIAATNTITATNTMTVGNSCVASGWVGGGSFACFRHKDSTAQTNYAVLSDANGNTYINGGTVLYLRVNNDYPSEVKLTTSGISTTKQITCGEIHSGDINCGAINSVSDVNGADGVFQNTLEVGNSAIHVWDIGLIGDEEYFCFRHKDAAQSDEYALISRPFSTYLNGGTFAFIGANGVAQVRVSTTETSVLRPLLVYGYLTASGGSNLTSDRRIKKNISSYTDGWDVFKTIKIKQYNNTAQEGRLRIGVIADEIKGNTSPLIHNSYRELDKLTINEVEYDKFGTVDYNILYRMNLRVTQQLQERVEALEARLAQIK